MATTSTTPRKRTASKATAAKTAASAPAETEDEGLVNETYTLVNRGRTRGGEGPNLYFNLHDPENGVRGQIFTGRDVVEVRVRIVRNPNAVIED